nr:PREDICTED: uncharacterized protein LOC105663359 [Megachile rotundata]
MIELSDRIIFERQSSVPSTINALISVHIIEHSTGKRIDEGNLLACTDASERKLRERRFMIYINGSPLRDVAAILDLLDQDAAGSIERHADNVAVGHCEIENDV